MADVFLQTPVSVALGTKTYEVVAQPIARIKRFKTAISDSIDDYNKLAVGGSEALVSADGEALTTQVGKFLDFFLDRPADIFSILIPDLDIKDFSENVTMPQLKAGFNAVIDANEIGWVRKALPFFQNLIAGFNLADIAILLRDMMKTVSSPGS